jgi:hypothetical protein
MRRIGNSLPPNNSRSKEAKKKMTRDQIAYMAAITDGIKMKDENEM